MSTKTVAFFLLMVAVVAHANSLGDEWSQIPGTLKQIDHGLTEGVWGVNQADDIYRLKSDNSDWQKISGSLKHVSVGEAGVWGVNSNDDIYYRVDVTESNPSGSSWLKISGKLKQIDSGPSGIVYGVDADDKNYCREGIDTLNPSGTSWKQVTSYARSKYISCGALGCWAVNKNDKIWYRSGVTKENCVGSEWFSVEGELKQIEAGLAGDVYGVDSAGYVYRRTGITESNPRGNAWKKILDYGSFITTGLTGQYLLVDGKIFRSVTKKCNGLAVNHCVCSYSQEPCPDFAPICCSSHYYCPVVTNKPCCDALPNKH